MATVAELQDKLEEQEARFREQQEQLDEMRKQLNARGAPTKITEKTCNVCGKKVTDAGCKDHPGEMVNNMGTGIDPSTNAVVPVLVSQTRGGAGKAA